MKAFSLKELLPTEADEAACLMQWARTQRHSSGMNLATLLIMIPNGAYLGGDARQRSITMASLKKQGFRNGVADFFLAAPIGDRAGLWIELKRQKLGVVSDEQEDFQILMIQMGYAAVIVKGWEAAVKEINQYLGVGTK